jgi:alpha-glucosidase
MSKKIYYTVSYQGEIISRASSLDLIIDDERSLSVNNSIRSYTTKKINSLIDVIVSDRRKRIIDEYNELNIVFKKPFQLTYRIYNDGIAYQIAVNFNDSIYIKDEIAGFNFENNTKSYIPIIHKREGEDIFHNSFEEEYPLINLDTLSEREMAYNPVLIMPSSGPRIAITESDLLDYPGMFLKGTNSNSLTATFAPFPLEEKITDAMYAERIVTKRAEYIAYIPGKRKLPWRIIMIADEDKKLPENDMVYKLATPSKIKDLSWITPSKGTDEWIIDINLFNIPFKAGINTETYKYYIDFAKRFGFDRIMMDAGWSDRNDLFNIIPEINMDTLSAYAKSKNIKLSMWTLALTLDKQLDSALLQFKKWGVDFIMTDFIDRDDQKMVNFYERIAKACAEQQIMIMYHGAPAPKGFNRTYPNAIGREGVLGSEYSIWSQKVTPQHNLILPFTRMLAGPLDYEPGFLNNVNKKSFRNIEGNPMSYGTRCHQLAMFVVYDSPIQIFSGNPSQGYFEPSFMELLGSIPTGWDETIVLDAKIGEYIVTARKKNNDWYIAGMNNWNAREQIINLDFLNGSNYNATICIDGINAEKFAADYSISQSTLNKNDKISIKSAPGGGFLLKLSKN